MFDLGDVMSFFNCLIQSCILNKSLVFYFTCEKNAYTVKESFARALKQNIKMTNEGYQRSELNDSRKLQTSLIWYLCLFTLQILIYSAVYSMKMTTVSFI